MKVVRAEVRGGRLVVDEPTDLPEGTVLELVLVEGGDDLDDDERAALHASLAEGMAQGRRGLGRSADELISDLRSRSR